MLGLLVAYNLVRLGTAVWALRTGFDAGMSVGAAIGASWLPRAVARRRPGGGVRASGSRFRWWPGGISAAFGWAGAIGSLAVAAVGVVGVPLVRPLARRACASRCSRWCCLLLFRWDRTVIEREATIVNQEGLHARPAARIVRLANSFAADIELAKDGVAVNGKSIMGVMMLAAECGSSITIRANGPDAEQAVAGARRAGGERVRGDVR